jgi:hypothetical protein
MKPALRIAAIAMMIAVNPALANETPHPTPQDNRIREVIFSEGHGNIFQSLGIAVVRVSLTFILV